MNETRLYFPGLKTFKAEGYNGLKLINKHSMLERLNWKILSRLTCFVVIVAIVMIILTAGCGNDGLIYTTNTENTEDTGEISEITEVILDEDLSGNGYLITNRALPVAEQEEINSMILSNNIFAFDLYQQLNKEEQNLFFSPYTVSRVMAVTYTGARGETANQILDAFRFDTEQDRLHEAFNSLDYILNSQDSSAQILPEERPLQTASAAWGQVGYSVPIDFFNILSAYYCGPIEALDFKYSPVDAENVIETWVSTQTDRLITNTTSSVTDRVRLAFASTMAINSNWAQPFNPDSTTDGAFKLLNGSTITVPIMTRTDYFPFTSEEVYDAIELEFENSSMSILLLIPEEGNFHEFDKTIDYALLDDIVNRLEPQQIELNLPRFSFASGEDLNDTFSELGITDALIEGQADFSGINKSDELYLNGSRYKAHIDLAESGVQGVSSTVLTLEGRDEIPEQGTEEIGIYSVCVSQANHDFQIFWPQPVEVTLSRPFIYIVRDTLSGAIVFLGKVMNPKN